MKNIFDEFKTNKLEEHVTFFGIVEDNADPMTLGRVKVRCFHYHTDNTTDIPTEALPWAMVFQPTTSAAISGIGTSPNGLEMGSLVYGFFLDGRDAQYPVVTHSIPTQHRPNQPGQPSGTATGFSNSGNYYGGDKTGDYAPYHGESPSGNLYDPTNPAAQGVGALTAVGNVNMKLQPKDATRWTSLGLPTYDWKPCPSGYACKDGNASLAFHYGTALAFEKATKLFGKGKLFLNSAYRTPAYNKKVGGATHSQHTAGRALDISLGSIGGKSEIARFGKIMVKCGFVGFGIYWNKNFIHCDTGKGRLWLGAKEQWFVDAIKSAGWHAGKAGLSDIQVNSGANTTTSNTTSSTTGNSSPTTTSGNPTTTNQAKDQIYQHFKDKGYSDTQIAGIMGNFQTESGFNPNANVTDTNGLESYGIAQWNGSRLTALRNYTGVQYPNLSQQLDFVDHELQTTHSRALTALQGASTPGEAAYAFGSNYEVYSGHQSTSSPSSLSRINNANALYNGVALPNNPIPGFVDPTNSLPTPEYRGEPSTHMNARGFNTYSNQQRIYEKDDGRMRGMPAAGDIGTFGEPDSMAAPQYPFNHVVSTRSGNMLEMDDTPQAERINLQQASGSRLEMNSDGSVVMSSKGNMYNMSFGDAYQGVIGKYFLTSSNDMHIRATADMVQQSDGSMTILIGNDGNMAISGDYLITVGEDVKIRATKIIFEATESIDLFSHKTVNITGKDSVNIKGGTSVNIDGKTTNMKADNIYMDDVVRVAENKAKKLDDAESSDLGAPPARKTIAKDNLTTTANKKGSVTTGDAADHYAGQTQ